jgi:hypothetical protein
MEPRSANQNDWERDRVTHENSGSKEWGIALGLLAGLILALLSLSDVPFAVTRATFSRESGAADPVVIIRHSRETQLAPQGLRDPKSSGDASRLDVSERVEERSNSSDAVTPDAKRTLLVDVPQSSASLSPVVPPPRDLPEDDPDTLLKHARFLIKAGLAPIAKEPLQKVVKEAPGTPIAREAQRTLDELSRN